MILTIFLLSGSIYAQNIEWETTFTQNELGERINDLSLTTNGDILCVGWSSPNIGPEPSMLKFDSAGNFKWFKRLRFDSLEKGNINFIREIPAEKDFYYVGGSSYELGVWNNDFIAKIDSSGDSVWCKFFNYPTFYGTTVNAIVLKDKSLVTIGVIQTATFYDIISRRVDSLGNTMWENIYNQTGEQFGYDLVEMMDGSIIIGGSSDNSILLIRIGFDGTLLGSVTFSLNNSSLDLLDLSLIPENNLILGSSTQDGSNNFIGSVYSIDTNLNINFQRPYEQGAYLGPLVLENKNYIFNKFGANDSFYIEITNPLVNNVNWDYAYGQFPNYFKSYQSMKIFEEDLYLAGVDLTGANQDYLISKVANVGPEWIPDRCAYQPPVAGFDYEYNYPVLTLRDTSSGGLKYLDTIYTWQWNTSAGTNGTDDSLVVFFDTAISQTIDIELVISNWYGCRDTVNQTLFFGETGLEVYEELKVNIFPNPTKDLLNIQINNGSGEASFKLYDLQGRLQVSRVLKEGQTTLSLENLTHGLYIYEVQKGEQVKRGKVVKQ